MAVAEGVMFEERTRETHIWPTVQAKGGTVIATRRENDEEEVDLVVLTVERKVHMEKIPPKRREEKEREEVEECEVLEEEVDADRLVSVVEEALGENESLKGEAEVIDRKLI